MNMLKRTAALLKKHGLLMWVTFECIMIGVIIATGVWQDKPEYMAYVLAFIVMIGWDISDARKLERISELEQKQIDKEKELVQSLEVNAKLEEEISIYKDLVQNRKENPLKSNRLVSDKTFATRLKSFVSEVRVNDPISFEEQEYLLNVAERLLKWQTKTVKKDSEEYKYLERIGLMPEPSPNTEEHPVPKPKESKPRRKPTNKKKTKTSENENQN